MLQVIAEVLAVVTLSLIILVASVWALLILAVLLFGTPI